MHAGWRLPSSCQCSVTPACFGYAAQIPRDGVTMGRLLTFSPGVDSTVVPQSSVAVVAGVALVFADLARLDNTRAILVGRNPLDNFKVGYSHVRACLHVCVCVCVCARARFRRRLSSDACNAFKHHRLLPRCWRSPWMACRWSSATRSQQ
jgi:hypothetical protein